MPQEHASLHRRPFMTPIWLTVLAAVFAMSFLVFAGWLWGTADSTTVVVIRHAEKETDAGGDPPLSSAGRARAELLAHMFGDTHAGRIDAIYVSPTMRSRMTAAPLAARLGLTPVEQSADSAALARRVLREHTGGRTLVIGHRDTVNEIVEALSGVKHLSPIGDDEYGTMYVVSVPQIGRANVLRLTY
jgi:2,3-bisphosphoglycerate-dependent phosphoglycerate mutase